MIDDRHYSNKAARRDLPLSTAKKVGVAVETIVRARLGPKSR
jgi:hypothetical protein